MNPHTDPLPETPADSIRRRFAKEPQTLSVDRLAELLGQGRDATYRQLNAREIPVGFRRHNGRWLIYSEDVCNWLIQCQREQGENRA